MKIWKWGVNYGGRNNPDHYELLHTRGIVLGRVERCNYEEGDLVAVTSGHMIRAIVRVTGTPVPITNRPDLEAPALEHNIEFIDDTVWVAGEWTELDVPINLPIRAGNRRVRKPELVEKVVNSWNEANT
jgi:hypothetical protein